VQHYPASFVRHAKVAGQRKGVFAFDFVRVNRDGREINADRGLVRGKERPAGQAVILAASLAPEAEQAGRAPIFIGVQPATFGANRLPLDIRPADFAERGFGFRFRHAEGVHFDAMLGLVAEFSDTPFVDGSEWISPMLGVLHTGHVCEQDHGLLTVEAMNDNLDKLPESFGGMSEGGLWRIYFVENEKESRIISTTLCGVASWQIDKTHIACQGWDRIEQGLIPAVRGKFRN